MNIPGFGRFRREKPHEPAYSGQPDEYLAGRAAADPAAFAEIYERYVDTVYRYCLRRLGTRDRAEDATSLVFTRVLGAIDRYAPRSSFRSWLFTIAHNVIMDQFRASGRNPEYSLDERWDAPDTDPTPEEAVVRQESVALLDRLMSVLTEDQKRVVELRLAGFTGAEIQDVLGRGRSWVNTTQFRAINRMRQALEETDRKGGLHV